MSVEEAIALLRDRARDDRQLARIYSGDGQIASFIAERANALADAVDVVVAAFDAMPKKAVQ